MTIARRRGLLCVALLLLGWAPSRNSVQWVQEIFAHRCSEIDRNLGQLHVHCAADGSVGAVETPVDFHVGRSFTNATVLWNRESPRTGVGHDERLRVASEGAYVLVEHTTCGMCARVMGQSWVVRPAHAPEGALRAAQLEAGLPGSPLLRTVEAWRNFATSQRTTDAGAPRTP